MRPMTEIETAVIIATVFLLVGLIVVVIVKDPASYTEFRHSPLT